MRSKRKKQVMLSFIQRQNDLEDRRKELAFVELFGFDLDENGAKVERTLTEDEKEELQQLVVDSEVLDREVTKVMHKYYERF